MAWMLRMRPRHASAWWYSSMPESGAAISFADAHCYNELNFYIASELFYFLRTCPHDLELGLQDMATYISISISISTTYKRANFTGKQNLNRLYAFIQRFRSIRYPHPSLRISFDKIPAVTNLEGD
jgi:hypothetical protein